MFFTITLYISLAIFLVGTIYQVRGWFHTQIGPDARKLVPGERMAAALRGMVSVLFGRRLFSLLRALVFDVLLQTRTLRRDFLRWLSHMLIFYGFMLLLLMHALDQTVTAALFPGYEATLNPFFFLRNLFGAMVLLGVALAAFRRILRRRPSLFTDAADRIALMALAVIIVSGFLLEGVKIISAPVFSEMVDEYAPMAEEEEVTALQTCWARDFGVLFPGPAAAGDPATLEHGREIHEDSCASCHDRPTAAFLSYSLSRAMAPAARFLNRARADRWLLPLHFLSCFIALAMLPFTKFFHILATPAGLLANAALNLKKVLPGNLATRRALALDACTHCGDCTKHCSVAPVFRRIPNPDILPSEKLISIRERSKGNKQDFASLQSLAEGSLLCTRCNRCTTICPSGISLQDLWIASSADLAEEGFPEPHIWVRERNTAEWAERIRYHADAFPVHRIKGQQKQRHRELSDRSETFEACIQCQTCTNVCPVVACAPDPKKDLGVTPQQIMNLLRIGLKELTLGSPMVWDCVTCYLCQENCPEGIRVTDILYELRNLGYEKFQEVRLEDKGQAGGPSTGADKYKKGES